jgi:pyruvate kinase
LRGESRRGAVQSRRKRVHRRQDGKPLKTKIVATLGALRGTMYVPGSSEAVTLSGRRDEWETFLGWFERGGGHLFDVLRLNMSFYEPREDGTPDPECKELTVLSLLRSQRERFRNVSVLGDLPGPKLRLLGVGEGIELAAGSVVELKLTGDMSSPTICAYGAPVAEEDAGVVSRLRSYVDSEKRPLISVGDGLALLRITRVSDSAVTCVAEDVGRLSERKGVTFKGLSFDIETFRDDDERAVDLLLSHGIDWKEHPWSGGIGDSFVSALAVSFVRRAEDIERAKRYVEGRMLELLRGVMPEMGEEELSREARNFAPDIIAKIETREAADDIERILDVADGAMVARGDLALQIGPHNVPGFQKRLIRLCNLRGKPVITATQMLSSMVDEPEPTRAEASDVFNAILDGTDAVMLSDETARGRYPVQAAEMMAEIAEAAERHLEGIRRFGKPDEEELRRLAQRRSNDLVFESDAETPRMRVRLETAIARAEASGDDWLRELYEEKLTRCNTQRITDEMSAASCAFSRSAADSDAIVAPTTSGRTARMIARFRPDVPVLGCAHDALNQKKLLMSFGVFPVNVGRLAPDGDGLLSDAESVFAACAKLLKSEGLLEPGNLIVWTAGSAVFVPGTTNLIEIRRIE